MANTKQSSSKELGLKLIFKLIIGAIVLLFFITSGILTIQRGHLLLGLLFFILSAATFIPHHYLRITQPLKWVIIIFLYIVLAGISGRDIVPEAPKYKRFELSQEFKIVFEENTFLMIVKEVREDNKIILHDNEVSTSGSFLIVKTEVENLGAQSADFVFKENPHLTDNQNRIFSLYGANIPVGKLHPNVAKEITYVFEIPKDASELIFIVKDKTKIIKSVDLGR